MMYCLKKVKVSEIALTIAIRSVIVFTKNTGHNKHKRHTALTSC